jgi:hypothetical protein
MCVCWDDPHSGCEQCAIGWSCGEGIPGHDEILFQFPSQSTMSQTRACIHLSYFHVPLIQECMYLHDVADMEVSFTKDDMHLGRHAEYERRLAEQLLGPAKTTLNPLPVLKTNNSARASTHKHHMYVWDLVETNFGGVAGVRARNGVCPPRG